jgi:hypothetical protein
MQEELTQVQQYKEYALGEVPTTKTRPVGVWVGGGVGGEGKTTFGHYIKKKTFSCRSKKTPNPAHPYIAAP